jgi:hypothetical protein
MLTQAATLDGMHRARHLARELALYLVFGAIALPLVAVAVYAIFMWFAWH